MNLSKLFSRGSFFLCFAVFFATVAHAQYRAGVQGTVTDSTGAIVKGAQVSVTSQETGTSQEATTNDSGFYSVPHLAPGLYNISITMTGFRTRIFDGVRIGAEETTGLNASLELGGVSEKVVVSGETLGQLETEDASLTGTITKQQVNDLPEFRGDPYELLRTAPGVFGQGARDSGGNASNIPGYSGVGGSNRGIFQIENAVQVSANGSRVEANGYELDGVSTNSQGWGGASVITPNTESVKEVKVEVSPYSAENAHGAGAVVEVVSQNGTNNFHGSAVLRVHSPGLNAFQHWGGPNGASPNRDNLLLHNYLGSIGGPIWKNKVFFFFSFEHMKTGGGQYRASSWVETSQWISNLGKNSSGTLASQIFGVKGTGFTNPKLLTDSTCAGLGLTEGATCKTVTGGVDLGSNTPGGQIANASGPNGYSVGGGLDGSPDVAHVEYDAFNDRIKATQYNGRLDFQVTQKDLVAFSVFQVPVTKTFLPGGWVDGRQYNIFNTDGTNETAALLWNHTVNPSTINEARMNVTRWYFDEIKSNPQAPFGVPVVNINIPNNSFTAGFPFGPGVFYQTKYVFRDTLSKVHGSHVLKFGGEVGKEHNNSATTWAARPTFNFNNLWSFANDAVNLESTTTFDPKTGVPTDFRKYWRGTTYGFFAQDNWKIKPNLTLTYGMRWDFFAPLHEKFGRVSNIRLGQGATTLSGATIRTGGDLTDGDYNNWGPQLGFAWSPRALIGHEFNNKFVLRGGVGVAYNRVPGNDLWQAAGNPPDFIAASLPASEGQIGYGFSKAGIYSFSGFPASPAAIETFDPATGLPQPTSEHFAPPDITGAVRNLATPYTWHYSLEGQYDFGHSWVAAVSYQAAQSRKYPRKVNYALQYARPTYQAGTDPKTGQPIFKPLIGNVNIYQTDVNSHYNALLTRLTHRMTKGLELSAEYRYSKSVDQCSSDAQCNQTYPYDQRTETGPSDFDATHTFKANTLYELPFFKSRHDWLYTLAGGWKIGGILQLNSGFPWTPIDGRTCFQVSGLDQTCPVRPAAYLGGAKSDFSTGNFQTVGNFPAKTAANATHPGLDYFTPGPQLGTYTGVPPAPTVKRNSFRGPRYTGIDMSFGKRFTLPKVPFFGEGAGFEVKANAFNVFNKVNLLPFGFNSASTNINDPLFGRATGALGGRVIEFLARFSF